MGWGRFVQVVGLFVVGGRGEVWGFMGRRLLWATAEDLAANKPRVLALYRQYLRVLGSEKLGLSLAAQETRKGHVRELFSMGAEERSSHNIRELVDAAEYTLTLLHKGQIPRESYNK